MSQPRLPAVQRRRQLLDVSLDVFAQRGFHAASMAEVAEAAGVTKPVLYQHFGSKRELYLELLDDVGQRLLEEVQKATAAAGGPRQQVAAGFAAYFRFVADHENASISPQVPTCHRMVLRFIVALLSGEVNR